MILRIDLTEETYLHDIMRIAESLKGLAVYTEIKVCAEIDHNTDMVTLVLDIPRILKAE